MFQQTKQAYGDIVKNNLNRLKAIARSYSDNENHEDLLQEILYQLWRGLASFKQESHVNTWVYRVALNTAISYRRSCERRPQLVTGADLHLSDTVHSGDLQDSFDILENFLSSLNKIDRAIMMLYLDDICHREISDITSLSVNVISVRINRMKQKFEKQFVNN